MGVSSVSSGGSSTPPSLDTIEAKIAQGTASPLLGLQDWSSQGILNRLTGTDGVLPGAQAIKQQAVTAGIDPSQIPLPDSDEGSDGSSEGPSSSASSTVSAMTDTSTPY